MQERSRSNSLKRLKGSMTVFLALLLSVFMAVTGVLAEYARVQMLSAKVQEAVSAAAESIFAGYSAPLFARYQLLARQLPRTGDAGLSRETKEYVDAWGSGNRLYINLAGFETEEAEWTGLVFATDENGVVFREMAAQALAASGLEVLSSYWTDHLGLGSGTVGSTIAGNNSESQAKASSLFPSFGELMKKIQEAEAAEAEEKRREEEALRQWKEAEKAAIEAGEEPPPKPAVRELTEAERQAQANRKEGKKYLKMLKSIRKLLTRGVLAATLPEGKTVSGGKIPAGSLPSSASYDVKHRKVRSGSGTGAGTLGKYVGNTFAFREYLMQNLDCYTSESGKSPLYELEYVIAGKSTDRKNLESVAARILAIRIGLNMLYLSSSTEKVEAAKLAATMAIAWTGQLYLIDILSTLLLTAWAAAESMADVHNLLDGRKVVLMKTDKDWQLSLEHAADEWKYADGEEPDDPKALSYEDYLRMLLYLDYSLSGQTYRAMDVIQWNVRKIDSEFQLGKCFVEGDLAVQADSRAVFTPMYGALVKKRGWLSYEKKSAYSYLKWGG